MDEIQKKLKAFISRRHPEYSKLLPHWTFMRACYEGGRSWFGENIFRYIKEGDQEYTDRVKRCYRFNHTREVVDLVDKYIFKMQVTRNEHDASDSVKRFWTNATLDNLSINDLIKQISKLTSIYGRIWVVTDTTKSEEVATKADEKAGKARVYTYLVTPENVCDMSYDDENVLNWILIHEQVRDDEDPIESSGEMIDRFRLWERNQWTLFTLRKKSGAAGVIDGSETQEFIRRIAELARRGETGELGTINPNGKSYEFEVDVQGPFPHGFDGVPVFAANHIVGHDLYASSSLIDDVAYLDRAVANYLSNLDAIIQDQTFSQLIMPAQGIVPGEDGYDKLLEMGTKRIFTYDGEGGKEPKYISPDVKQAELVLSVISKIINEIYHTVGLAGERTKEDNSVGIDNSSGVAKAYDFERVNSLLAAKADSLEVVENRLVDFVMRWNGEDNQAQEKLVGYPDDFDVRGLYDEFEIAARLSLIEAPDSVRRQQMEAVIDKLFPQLGKDLKEKMLSELKSWPPEPVDLMTGAPGQGGSISKAGKNSLANKLVKEGE